MGKKNKNKSNVSPEKKYKTPEQEAKRALANILNFELKAFCLIVDLDVRTPETETETTDPNQLITCLGLIQEKAPDCSVLLISESVRTESQEPILAVAALSSDPSELVPKDWVNHVIHSLEGFEKKDSESKGGESKGGESKGGESGHCSYLQLLIPDTGVSVLKEKDKALSAGFQWLKTKGLAMDSDSDSGENFMASFEFEDQD